MPENSKIGFIGAGTMGRAIIRGLINSSFIDKKNIIASEVSEQLAGKVSEELEISVITDNIEIAKNSDVIILCAKPFAVKGILQQIKDFLSADKIIVSIAAGMDTGFIESVLEKEIPVIRVMPNTPALVGEGMTAVCRGKYATKEQAEFIVKLFSQVGRCIEIDEKYINAVTGISGSGPAFIYLIIEALADGGVKLGLPKKIAIELAAQTTLGAAKMVIETGKHPSVLKDEVTTPGGCTIAGLMVMEENKVRSTLAKTVQETAKVALNLGK